jgi:hypothetical protein
MKNQEIRSKIKDYMVKLGRVFFFILSVILGYSVCEIYHRTKIDPSVSKGVKNISETSVAINERGEMMIIDRKTGDYSIYQDSVGKSIFTLYANSIQAKYEKTK